MRSRHFRNTARAVHRYGRHHFAPYEPERYLPWAKQAGMKVFFGNLEDPRLQPVEDDGLLYLSIGLLA